MTTNIQSQKSPLIYLVKYAVEPCGDIPPYSCFYCYDVVSAARLSLAVNVRVAVAGQACCTFRECINCEGFVVKYVSHEIIADDQAQAAIKIAAQNQTLHKLATYWDDEENNVVMPIAAMPAAEYLVRFHLESGSWSGYSTDCYDILPANQLQAAIDLNYELGPQACCGQDECIACAGFTATHCDHIEISAENREMAQFVMRSGGYRFADFTNEEESV